MNRLMALTIVILLGAGVAMFDLFNGWTANGTIPAIIVAIGLIPAALALFGAMLIAGRNDRKRMVAGPPDAKAVLGQAAQAMRWSGAFAVGFAVLLFTNCSSATTTTASGRVPSAWGDMTGFLTLTAVVLAPLLVALLLPPILTTVAQQLATSRPPVARRMASLAGWASVLAAVLAVVTIPIGFFFGISACFLGPSAGACSAGASSFMNFLSLGSLALFLPYVGLVSWALARMEYDRTH